MTGDFCLACDLRLCRPGRLGLPLWLVVRVWGGSGRGSAGGVAGPGRSTAVAGVGVVVWLGMGFEVEISGAATAPNAPG